MKLIFICHVHNITPRFWESWPKQRNGCQPVSAARKSFTPRLCKETTALVEAVQQLHILLCCSARKCTKAFCSYPISARTSWWKHKIMSVDKCWNDSSRLSTSNIFTVQYIAWCRYCVAQQGEGHYRWLLIQYCTRPTNESGMAVNNISTRFDSSARKNKTHTLTMGFEPLKHFP